MVEGSFLKSIAEPLLVSLSEMNDDEPDFIKLYQVVKIPACIILNHVEFSFIQNFISHSLD